MIQKQMTMYGGQFISMILNYANIRLSMHACMQLLIIQSFMINRGVARILSMGGLDSAREAREKFSLWPRPLIRIT